VALIPEPVWDKLMGRRELYFQDKDAGLGGSR
jgi:hypothetical protein